MPQNGEVVLTERGHWAATRNGRSRERAYQRTFAASLAVLATVSLGRDQMYKMAAVVLWSPHYKSDQSIAEPSRNRTASCCRSFLNIKQAETFINSTSSRKKSRWEHSWQKQIQQRHWSIDDKRPEFAEANERLGDMRLSCEQMDFPVSVFIASEGVNYWIRS